MFLLVLAGFVLLMIVFTFFDLVGDILRNHIALAIVGEYLLNLTPSMLYQIAPLAVLIAALVDIRRAQPQQRNRRHEGHRHQPLPAGRSHRHHCCLPGREPVSL